MSKRYHGIKGAVSAAAAVLVFALFSPTGAVFARDPVPALEHPPHWGFPERWLPVDEEGWTILAPSNDIRLIYVSSTDGDDETAVVYPPASPEVGDDPFLPAGDVRPYARIEAALEQARAGHGDWVLLRRGDSWDNQAMQLPDGRSTEAPFVLGAYGAADERPVLRGNSRLRVGHHRGGAKHVVITGVEIYDSRKDPDSPDHAVVAGENMNASGMFFAVGRGNAFRNVLVEDCLLRYAHVSFINYDKRGRQAETPISDVVIRRSLILDMYRPIGHTVGIWANDASFLLEECILDHNGWLHYRTRENREANKPGIAFGLSHNTYVCNVYNTVFRGNMFLRGASQGNKWSALREHGVLDVLVDDNLYAANEIVGSAGGNGVGGHRFVNMAMINNVATHFGKAEGTRLGYGISITDWDGGLFAGNLFRGPRFPQVGQNWAIRIASRQWHGGWGGGTAPRDPDDPSATPGKGLRNVLVARNTFYDMDGGWAVVGTAARTDASEFLENVTFAGNRLHMPGIDKVLIEMREPELAKFDFSGNAYHAGGETWFQVDGRRVDSEEWLRLSGEEGATAEPMEFPDPDRALLAYMEHLGYEPSLEAFYREVRRQSRRNWRPEFTAPVINSWLREGFGMERVELERDEDGRYCTPFRIGDEE